MTLNNSIIFMGTPDFAVPSLKELINKFNVIAVITSLDKQKGRGRKVMFSPIKTFAIENKIPVFQPPNLKDPIFIKKIKSLKPDLFVVVAFRMLPKILIEIPEMGCINLHSSLLPQYRGAAPINWVLINGEKETGITTFFINDKIDEGDIIDRKKIKINKNDTAGTLHDRLMIQGSKMLSKTISKILNQKVTSYKQKMSSNDKLAPKINKEICRIDLDQNTEKIENLVRGLSPYPGANINYNNKFYKIILVKKTLENIKSHNNLFSLNNKLYLNNNFGETLEIIKIQAEGKKIMDASDFLRGNKL